MAETNYRRIYFSDGDKTFFLPVNPPEIEVVSQGNNETREIVKIGEINILKLPKLGELSIESFFPLAPFTVVTTTDKDGVESTEKVWKPYVNKPFKNEVMKQEDYVEFFRKAQANQKPILFKIVYTDDINKVIGKANDELKGVENWSYMDRFDGKNYSVEAFKTKEQGGDPDLHYSLSLKEYKNYGAKKMNSTFAITVDNSGNKVVEPPKPTRSESLQAMAKKRAREANNKARLVARTAQKAVKIVTGTMSGINIIKSGANSIG